MFIRMFIRAMIVMALLVIAACASNSQSIDLSSSERTAKVFPATYTLQQKMALLPDLYMAEIVAVDGVPVKMAGAQ